MQDETPKRRIRELREESSKKLRKTVIQLGESLLRSRGVPLPPTKVERDRVAQIEAYKDLIRSKTRELEDWKQSGHRAAKLGMAKPAQFRQQMIMAMEGQLRRYEEELRRLRSIPGSSWTGST